MSTIPLSPKEKEKKRKEMKRKEKKRQATTVLEFYSKKEIWPCRNPEGH